MFHQLRHEKWSILYPFGQTNVYGKLPYAVISFINNRLTLFERNWFSIITLAIAIAIKNQQFFLVNPKLNFFRIQQQYTFKCKMKMWTNTIKWASSLPLESTVFRLSESKIQSEHNVCGCVTHPSCLNPDSDLFRSHYITNNRPIEYVRMWYCDTLEKQTKNDSRAREPRWYKLNWSDALIAICTLLHWFIQLEWFSHSAREWFSNTLVYNYR